MKKNVFHKIIWYVVIFSLIGLIIEIMMGFWQRIIEEDAY